MKLIRLIMLCAAFISMPGCFEGGSSGAGSEIFIPSIDIDCSPIQASCSSGSAGKTIYLGLTSNTGVSCSTYMATMTLNFNTYFDASGTATTNFTGGRLKAVVENYVSDLGGSKSVMLNTTYTICAFVDLNGNGRIDNNEPEASTTTLLSNANSVPLTNWVNH